MFSKVLEMLVYEACEFKNICKYYRSNSHTCNREPGPYCGQFRTIKENYCRTCGFIKNHCICDPSRIHKIKNFIRKKINTFYFNLATLFEDLSRKFYDKYSESIRKTDEYLERKNNMEEIPINVH